MATESSVREREMCNGNIIAFSSVEIIYRFSAVVLFGREIPTRMRIPTEIKYTADMYAHVQAQIQSLAYTQMHAYIEPSRYYQIQKKDLSFLCRISHTLRSIVNRETMQCVTRIFQTVFLKFEFKVFLLPNLLPTLTRELNPSCNLTHS